MSHRYLSHKHVSTTISILLGVAASKRGSRDGVYAVKLDVYQSVYKFYTSFTQMLQAISRVLCCHLPLFSAAASSTLLSLGPSSPVGFVSPILDPQTNNVMDLNLPAEVQAAALVGLGLLWQV